jgi:hypothetical protein
MTVIVDNTGFSVAHWSRFTEAEFIEQAMNEGFFKQHNEADRRLLLSFAYKQVQDDAARNAKEAERV